MNDCNCNLSLDDLRWTMAWVDDKWPGDVKFTMHQTTCVGPDDIYFMWPQGNEVVCIHGNFANDSETGRWMLQQMAMKLISKGELTCIGSPSLDDPPSELNWDHPDTGFEIRARYR